MSNIYYWEKLTFSKLVIKVSFFKRKFEKCSSFEQKGIRYIQGKVYFSIIVFSCLSSLKLCLRFLLICFAWSIKGFYQSSLGNKVDFRVIMNVSPIILGKNFKKVRHGFVHERALIITTSISYWHWKTLVPFWLWMKRPENVFSVCVIFSTGRATVLKQHFAWIFIGNNQWNITDIHQNSCPTFWTKKVLYLVTFHCQG